MGNAKILDKLKSRIAILTAIFVMLTACSNEFSEMPDADLADGIYDCRTEAGQSPGMAIRCDNYRRECKRRRDDGRYIC